MAKIEAQKTSAVLSGVSAGKTTSPPVATGNPSGEVARLSSDKDATVRTVIDAGGNKGGRPREDGLVPGSPEAIAKDREKNTERKRLAREREREQRVSEPLKPASSPALGNTPPPLSSVDSLNPLEAGQWLPADFNHVVVDVVSFAETARIRNRTKKAIDGNLPPVVAEQIGNSFAFPVETKNSLSRSSPEGLAKLFNSLKIPVTFKPAITAFPALTYLFIRDAQMDEKLDKMIAEEAEKRRRIEAAKTTTTT